MTQTEIDVMREHTAALNRYLDHQGTTVLISSTEAARLLGRTRQTISSLIRRGKLRKITVGSSTGLELHKVLALRKA